MQYKCIPTVPKLFLRVLVSLCGDAVVSNRVCWGCCISTTSVSEALEPKGGQHVSSTTCSLACPGTDNNAIQIDSMIAIMPCAVQYLSKLQSVQIAA